MCVQQLENTVWRKSTLFPIEAFSEEFFTFSGSRQQAHQLEGDGTRQRSCTVQNQTRIPAYQADERLLRPSSKLLTICRISFVTNQWFFLQGLSLLAVRFRFDGIAINDKDTPISLQMEDGDTIEVFQQQTGGASGDDPVSG